MTLGLITKNLNSLNLITNERLKEWINVLLHLIYTTTRVLKIYNSFIYYCTYMYKNSIYLKKKDMDVIAANLTHLLSYRIVSTIFYFTFSYSIKEGNNNPTKPLSLFRPIGYSMIRNAN